jgi:hypothetical protein
MSDAPPAAEEGNMRYKRRTKKASTPKLRKTNMIFLGEEEQILIKKMNKEIMDKLNIKSSQSFIV